MLTSLLERIDEEKERVKQTWAESLLHDTRISKDNLKDRYNRLTRLGKKVQRLIPELEELLGKNMIPSATSHASHLVQNRSRVSNLPVGSILEAQYKGKRLLVTVVEGNKLELDGKHFNSLREISIFLGKGRPTHMASKKHWKIILPANL